jgi:threonine dehydratase
MTFFPKIKDIANASHKLSAIMNYTMFRKNVDMSNKYNSSIFLKREDLTPVRSYKIRGAYNKISSLKEELNTTNIKLTCASAGNHAQGVAYSCNLLNIKSDIFMPKITTKQKIDKVEKFGGLNVNIHLEGNNFDETSKIANEFMRLNNSVYIHPFNDEKVIEGQATVGYEILNQLEKIDYIILPIGGGGLASGVSACVKQINPKIKIIGVEPLGAASMKEAIKQNQVVTLDKIDNFVDGAAVKRVGELNFNICKETLDEIILIDEGHVCSKILEVYNQHSYIFEPAGVLSLCALDILKPKIINKNVVCIISGGNSDVFRMNEILERSLIYEGLKHYFKIQFPQKAGALKEFILKVLGKNDDIIYFKYEKIINKELGPVILGIELKDKNNINKIVDNMNKYEIIYEKVKLN